MLKLEQVRAEMLDRFERIDRRFAQQDQRLERILQRVTETLDAVVVGRESLVANHDPRSLVACQTTDDVPND